MQTGIWQDDWKNGKSLQARAKPSRPQTAAPAVSEWADPGCETVREQGCLTEWMKMIQSETEAKSEDTVRKWESSNSKVASSCQNVRSSKVKSVRERAGMKVHAWAVTITPSFRRLRQGDWHNQGPPGLSWETLVEARGREGKGGERIRKRWLAAEKNQTRLIKRVEKKKSQKTAWAKQRKRS